MMILCLLLAAALAVPAFAAGTATLTASSVTVYRGGTFTVTVGVSGWGGCTTGSVEVSHDSAFTMTGGEWLIEKPDISYFDVGAREGGFGYSSSKKLSGNLAKLTFKVKDNAAFSTGKVTVNVNLGGTKVTKTIDITVDCSHKYSDWAYYSATVHLRRCSICAKEETAEHTYDHNCDTTCNGCGAERTITHDFSKDWTSDETGHWHGCTVCGEKSDNAAHVPGPEAGEYTDQVCTVCNYVLTPALGHTHRYDDTYQTDAKDHWKQCTGCQEPTEKENHSFEGDCDTTCDSCGYVRQITHQEGAWEYTDSEHWKICGNCQQKLYAGEHTWDAGYVQTQPTTTKTGLRIHHCTVCMAEKQQIMEKAAITDPAGGWAWWIWMAIGACGGVIVTAGVGLIVILLKVKTKSKGRYSG